MVSRLNAMQARGRWSVPMAEPAAAPLGLGALRAGVGILAAPRLALAARARYRLLREAQRSRYL